MDPPGDYFALVDACQAHVMLGQYEPAIADCEKAKGLSVEDTWADIMLTAAYAHHGDTAKAAAAKVEVLRRNADLTIAGLKESRSLHPDYVRLAEERIYSGLRKAGFPEK